MSSYTKVSDVVTELNTIIEVAPIPEKIRGQLVSVVEQLDQIPETVREHLVEKGDSIALHHDD